jgi:hypothetical protein
VTGRDSRLRPGDCVNALIEHPQIDAPAVERLDDDLDGTADATYEVVHRVNRITAGPTKRQSHRGVQEFINVPRGRRRA